MTVSSLGAPAFSRHINAVSLFVAIATVALMSASLQTRPNGGEFSVWRPATGLAVGVAGWYSPREAWRVAVAAGLGSAVAAAIAGRPLVLCIGAAVVPTLETWIGALVLRGRTGRAPTIANSAALRRLLLATSAVGLVSAVGAAVFVAGSLGPEQVRSAVLTITPTHMAGMLLVAPLFFVRPPAFSGVRLLESILQLIFLGAIIAVTFVFTVGLPIAFLALPPLVWGAARLPYRQFVVQLVLTSLTISALTVNSSGPFGAAEFSSTTRTLLTGIFSLTVGVLVFTVIASAANARASRDALDATEAMYREAFEASAMGVGVLDGDDGALTLSRLNKSGRSILGLGSDANLTVALADVLTADDARALRRAVDDLEARPSVPWLNEHLETSSGQVLEASLIVLTSSEGRRASLQFIDVTARQRALEADAQERRLAVGIQAALVPAAGLAFPGYEIAGRSVSSRALGGDFYDWYAVAEGFGVTVGDVMGKGAGASMLAASLRTSLRLEGGLRTPAVAVARVARVVEDEMSSASTFATVFAARVTKKGRVRYVDAGHGLALVCRSDGSWTQLNSHGLPVGVVAGSRWADRSAQLGAGDTLVIFSDGVLDVFDGSLDAFDEIGRMSESAGSSGALVDRIFDLVDSDAMDDDVTVIAIRRS